MITRWGKDEAGGIDSAGLSSGVELLVRTYQVLFSSFVAAATSQRLPLVQFRTKIMLLVQGQDWSVARW